MVSIIVPVYNMGDKLTDSVHTLTKQTYQNIELILVDDGSKDNSLEVCMQLAAEDERIRVYHTENHGSGPARNHGIANATGKYLYFPDADDYVAPNAIETMLRCAELNDADMVLCGYQYIGKNDVVLSERKYKPTVVDAQDIRNRYAFYKVLSPDYGLCGAPWNKLFRKSVVDDYHLEYPPLRRHQDEGFIARFIGKAKTVVFIEEVLYKYLANDQRAEWQKYPVDYIDAVIGLYECRKQDVLTWNTSDQDTKALIANEFICNFIKALELSFSPKFDFDARERKQWMVKQIERSKITEIDIPRITGKYQKIVLKFLNKNRISTVYFILAFKTFVYNKIIS